MSQVFDALERSGVRLPGLDSAAESSINPDASSLDRAPAFRVDAIPERRLVTLAKERSVAAERIRMLGVRLRRLQQQHPVKTVLITSSIKDEGKSVLSANLAISLAKAKQHVLLIDGDCHQAGLARLLGTSRSPGLTDWWRSAGSILAYLRRVNDLPLWFLPAGEPSPDAVEMLQSARVSEMLTQVASGVDWVIVDSPPFAPLADSAIWVGLTDASLLVARLGKTPKKLLRKVLDSVDQQKFLGVVLNDCSDPHLSHYAQYYKSIPLEESNGTPES
jgi:capsular exopolysaccharide synthesis family protein